MIKSTSLFLLSNLIGKGASFLMLPFFTYYLTRHEYGQINLFTNTVYLFSPIVNFGIPETFTLFYKQLDASSDKRKFVTTSLILPLAAFVILGFAGLVCHTFIEKFTGFNQVLLLLIGLNTLSNFFSEYLFSLLRNQNLPYQYAFFQLLKVVSELCLAYVLIKFYLLGFWGRIWSTTIAFVLFALIAILLLLKNRLLWPLSFDKALFQEIVRLGLPSIPLAYMLFAVDNLDKYIINATLGADTLGVYTLAWQVVFVLNVVSSSFIVLFYPFLYRSLDEDAYPAIKKVITGFLFFFILTALLWYSFVNLFFADFIHVKYIKALDYIPYLLIGKFLWGLFTICLGILYYHKMNDRLYRISFLTLAVSAFLYTFTSSQAGMNGVLFSNIISYLLPLLLIAPAVRPTLRRIFY